MKLVDKLFPVSTDGEDGIVSFLRKIRLPDP